MTVDIVPDLDEYEPVPHAHVVAAHGHLVRPSQEPGLASQDELSHPPRGYGEDSPDQLDSRDCGEEDKPKPEHDVDLFIYDVQRENAESIIVFNCSRGSILVESTLCNLRENTVHWIIPGFRILLAHRKHLTSICSEDSSKKIVKEKDLANYIDKVEKLTESKPQKVVPVLPVAVMVFGDEIILHFSHCYLCLLSLY